ncbi:hypothetical protein FRC09_007773 [Ceratobasidium sp. 395]|nr:hypothetical protein FRC09_007773 [Ceratobasidium sp. 395]
MPGGPKITSTAARRQPARTASQSKNPEPPKDPPLPTPDPAPEHVMPPVPQSFKAAHAYLVGQNLLRKEDKVIPGTVVNLLNQIAQHPDLHPTFAVVCKTEFAPGISVLMSLTSTGP